MKKYILIFVYLACYLSGMLLATKVFFVDVEAEVYGIEQEPLDEPEDNALMLNDNGAIDEVARLYLESLQIDGYGMEGLGFFILTAHRSNIGQSYYYAMRCLCDSRSDVYTEYTEISKKIMNKYLDYLTTSYNYYVDEVDVKDIMQLDEKEK